MGFEQGFAQETDTEDRLDKYSGFHVCEDGMKKVIEPVIHRASLDSQAWSWGLSGSVSVVMAAP